MPCRKGPYRRLLFSFDLKKMKGYAVCTIYRAVGRRSLFRKAGTDSPSNTPEEAIPDPGDIAKKCEEDRITAADG
jgi:hypothetical protein